MTGAGISRRSREASISPETKTILPAALRAACSVCGNRRGEWVWSAPQHHRHARNIHRQGNPPTSARLGEFELPPENARQALPIVRVFGILGPRPKQLNFCSLREAKATKGKEMSGKALAAGSAQKPAASALPLTIIQLMGQSLTERRFRIVPSGCGGCAGTLQTGGPSGFRNPPDLRR